MSFDLQWETNGQVDGSVDKSHGPDPDLSSARFITLSSAAHRITLHATREAAEAFATSTSSPILAPDGRMVDNAVYVFELKGAYCYPWQVTYP